MTTDPTSPKRKPGRPRLQFKTEITVRGVPCPPEHAAAYWRAWRLLFEAAGIIPMVDGAGEVKVENELGACLTVAENEPMESNGR